MTKSLKALFEVYRPKAKDEADFVDKHVTIKHKDRNGNGDDVFQASNIKKADRKKERHGYEPGEDEKVYEEIDSDLEDELKATRQTKKSVSDAKKKYGVKEETELQEGMMKLSKVHIVHHHDHPAAREFAKNYTDAMKGDHREGGPTASDEKAANKFYQRYTGVRTREGFAGSGTHIYTDHKTGAKWKVDKHPNGKTFYGTDHIISHHTGGMHESVEDDMYFTEEEDRVIRSLAGAAEELGEELDLETLCGLAEEVLSELSNDTVKAYATRAFDQANTLIKTRDKDLPKSVKKSAEDARERRRKGIVSAGKRLGKDQMQKLATDSANKIREEVEELDELSTDTLRSYRAKAKDDAYDAYDVDDDRRLRKRSEGAYKAGKKILKRGDTLRKENVEELDELSRKTLGSYVSKASKSATSNIAGAVAGSVMGTPSEDSRKMGRKSAQRLKGIDTAVKKLTKEDIINKAIEAYIPEDVELPSLEERLVDKLDEQNIPEQHIHILLSMFESLNEQNQNRMLEQVETVDGINSLLDFAISNRGD